MRVETTALVLWLVVVIASPWPFGSTPDPFRYTVSAVAALVALLVGSRFGWGEVRGVLPLLLLPVLQVLLGTSRAPALTVDAALQLACVVAALLAVTRLCADRGRRRLVAIGVVASALVQAAFGVVQHVTQPASVYGRSTPWTTTPFASFVNHNHFAALACCGALLAVGLAVQAWRTQQSTLTVAATSTAAGILVIAVLASRSRGGLVSLAVGLAAAALLVFRVRARVGIPAVAMLLALALMLLPEARARMATLLSPDASMGYRAELARASLSLAAARPLAGSGLGAFEDAVPEFKQGHGQVSSPHAESDALEFVADTGLLGVLALGFAAFSLRRTVQENLASRSRRHLTAGALAAVTALVVNAGLDFAWRTPAVAVALVSCVAVAAAPTPADDPARPRRWVPVLLAVLAAITSWRAWGAVEARKVAAERAPMARLALAEPAARRHPGMPGLVVETARARVALGRRAMGASDLAQASEEYRRALRGRPSWAAVWYELAWVEWARGRPHEAREALDRSSQADPVGWELGLARARLAARLQGPARAEEIVRALGKRNPDVAPEQIESAVRKAIPLK